MNIVGISYGPPQQVAGGELVRRVTTTIVAAPTSDDSTSVSLGNATNGATAGNGVLSASGFGRTGIAAYRGIAA
jgi:hypothetical protein